MDLESAALSFAEYLAALRGRGAATVRAYLRDLADYEAWASERPGGPAAQLSRNAAGLYLMSRMEDRKRSANEPEQLSARSAARAVSALKAWGLYLVFSGELQENPFEGLRAPKYSRRLPAYYSVEEILGLLNAWNTDDSALALRNSALLAALYSTGIRVSECAGLSLGDIMLEERKLRVRGKGNKERQVPFGRELTRRLEQWLTEGRPQFVSSATSSPRNADALWLSRRGARLTARSISNVLDESCLRVGFAKPLSPHKLRHACATHMLEGGAEVRLLQDFLGHESINTTQVYTQVTRTKLREVYDEAHPRARRKAP